MPNIHPKVVSSSTIDNFFQIMKQKKMIHFGENMFFNRLDIDFVEGDTTTGGVLKNKDGMIYPCMFVCENDVDFVADWGIYLGNIEFIEEKLKIYSSHGPKNNYGMRRILRSLARGDILYAEYDEFCEDPEIGDQVVQNQEEYTICVLCHEFAHCLQFWNCEEGFDKKGAPDVHNDVWKKYYKILRREFGLVNKQKRDYGILRKVLGWTGK